MQQHRSTSGRPLKQHSRGGSSGSSGSSRRSAQPVVRPRKPPLLLHTHKARKAPPVWQAAAASGRSVCPEWLSLGAVVCSDATPAALKLDALTCLPTCFVCLPAALKLEASSSSLMMAEARRMQRRAHDHHPQRQLPQHNQHRHLQQLQHPQQQSQTPTR